MSHAIAILSNVKTVLKLYVYVKTCLRKNIVVWLQITNLMTAVRIQVSWTYIHGEYELTDIFLT